MGEHIDKLKAAFDSDRVELAGLERVKSYFRTVNGKKVKVSGHSRKGEGPGHRKAENALYRLTGAGKQLQQQKNAGAKYLEGVEKYQRSRTRDSEMLSMLPGTGTFYEQLRNATDEQLQAILDKINPDELSGGGQGDYADILHELKSRKSKKKS